MKIACAGSGDDASVRSTDGASCFRNAIAWSTLSWRHPEAVEKIIKKNGKCNYAQIQSITNLPLAAIRQRTTDTGATLTEVACLVAGARASLNDTKHHKA